MITPVNKAKCSVNGKYQNLCSTTEIGWFRIIKRKRISLQPWGFSSEKNNRERISWITTLAVLSGCGWICLTMSVNNTIDSTISFAGSWSKGFSKEINYQSRDGTEFGEPKPINSFWKKVPLKISPKLECKVEHWWKSFMLSIFWIKFLVRWQ